MAVLVSFMQPGGLGSVNAVGVGRCRVAESLTLSTGVTTTNAAADGEIALVVSTEAATIRGARGTVPDAATTAGGSVSDASFPIPPNTIVPVAMRVGEKLNFKPLA